MKKSFLFLGLALVGYSYGQTNRNISLQAVEVFSPFNAGLAFPQILSADEIFRFRPGAVTQLQQGTDFDFGPNNRWFSLGEVTQGQTFYGSRFQFNERALVMGYSDAAANNPRIQWIHNGGSTAGNLEFRTASSFTSTQSTLNASMTPTGSTLFGNISQSGSPFASNFNQGLQKVGVLYDTQFGMRIINSGSGSFAQRTGLLVDAIDNAAGVVEGGRFTAIGTSASLNTGLQGRAESGESARGVSGRAINSGTNVGVFGNTLGQGSFAAAIYGETPQNGNHFAGFFDGDVVVTQQFSASDAKLKSNVSNENDALRQISQLRPVTYLFKENSGMNLSREFQHGFIAQELAEVFPELTKRHQKTSF